MTPNDDRKNISENELAFWNFAFEDLNKSLERTPRQNREKYFKELFYYTNDYDELKKETIRASNYGHNLIYQGVAGSGKTTLVKRYVIDEEFQVHNLFPLYVASLDDNKPVGYIKTFIEEMLRYISKIKYPIKIFPAINPANIIDNDSAIIALNNLMAIIKKLDIPSRSLKPLVFFDDLDYSEKYWKEITVALRNFISDANITFVFTLRPRLEHIILSDRDDRIRYLYHNTEKNLMLIPNVFEMLLNRIFVLLKPEAQEEYTVGFSRHSIFIKLNNFFNSYTLKSKKDTYLSFLKDLGIESVDDLLCDQLPFPFQESYLTFMAKIVNSNLRRVFLIAHETILHLRNHRDAALEINKNGLWEVNVDLIAKLFFKNPKSKWNILDINQKKGANGVSIYYAILHILHDEPESEIKGSKSYKIIQSNIKNIMKDKVCDALDELSGKELALIDFIGLFEGEPRYKLNRKGLYYLEVANWPQYIKCFGPHNYSYKEC